MTPRWIDEPHFLPPRGPREIAWTTTSVILLLLGLALPGGWYVLACTAATVWLIGYTPRLLAIAGFTSLATVAATTTVVGGATGYPALVWHVMHLFTASTPNTADLLAMFLVDTPIALLATAVLLAMPNRKVMRGVVDERLWTRQQARRRRVLRREAQQNPPPLVVP